MGHPIPCILHIQTHHTTILHVSLLLNTNLILLFTMSANQASNAIYFPEGAGYLLVKVLQTRLDDGNIESDVMLVKSIDDNKLYIRKIVELTEESETGIPNEFQFNPTFYLVPRVKDITKYVHGQDGEYYWAICTEFCNGGDLRGLYRFYNSEFGPKTPEILIWKFTADMCDTLSFLGENNIEHKDIWPQNIFLRYPDDNFREGLPDFVLGDFGWAVPLKTQNQAEDIALFFDRVWEMCYGCLYPRKRNMCAGSHLSLDLRERLDKFMVMADKHLITANFLVNFLMPYADGRVREICSQGGSIPRFMTASAVASNTENGSVWPTKLQNLLEDDWQVVNITQFRHGSGKLSIQGLSRDTFNPKRGHSTFIRCCPGPVDLGNVYLFNAGGNDGSPPKKRDLDLAFAGTARAKEAKEYLEQQKAVADDQMAKKKDSFPGKRMRYRPDKNYPPCKRIKYRHDVDSAKVGVGYPLMIEAVHRMNWATWANLVKAHAGNSDLIEDADMNEALVLSLEADLKEEIALGKALDLSEAMDLNDEADLIDAVAMSEADVLNEADVLSEEDALSEAASHTSLDVVDAGHLWLGKTLTRKTLVGTACIIIAASLLSIILQLV